MIFIFLQAYFSLLIIFQETKFRKKVAKKYLG